MIKVITRRKQRKLLDILVKKQAISMPRFMWKAMGFPDELWSPTPKKKITRKELKKIMEQIEWEGKIPRWLERMLGLPDTWS